MKTSKILFAALLLSFNLSNISAQLKVTTDGSVRVGNHGGGTFTVTNNSKSKGFYNQTSNNSSSTMYGFYNQMHGVGTGRKYGIYNYTNQNTSSSNLTYGLYNTTYTKGTGRGYGIYNNLLTYNSNISYGFYNNINSQNSSTKYGIYNNMYGTSSYRYGIYNNVTSANGGYGIYNNVSKATGYTGTVYGLFSYTNVNDGYAALFSGNVAVVGSFTNISDARTKENIQPVEAALNTIKLLQPKTYNFLKDETLNLPQEKQYGFMAQEVEKIMPELIKEIEIPNEKDPLTKSRYKSVNYTAFVPLLVKAVQEQQELIAEQALRIKILEEKINK